MDPGSFLVREKVLPDRGTLVRSRCLPYPGVFNYKHRKIKIGNVIDNKLLVTKLGVRNYSWTVSWNIPIFSQLMRHESFIGNRYILPVGKHVPHGIPAPGT